MRLYVHCLQNSPECRSNMILLKTLFPDNFTSVFEQLIRNRSNCRLDNATGAMRALLPSQSGYDSRMLRVGVAMYAYATPFIVVVGLVGNGLLLKVFARGAVSNAAATRCYLMALATSDSLVLVTYVLLDWLKRGLPQWPGGWRCNVVDVDGVCQAFLLLSYVFRFLSAWLVVSFTVERYVGVCRPLDAGGGRECPTRVVSGLCVLALLLSLYKPVLSEVRRTAQGDMCTLKVEQQTLVFYLDTVYGVLITGVPFVVIATLNILIGASLYRTRRRHRRATFASGNSAMAFDLNVVLISVSTSFILLNLPYFVVWSLRVRQHLNTVPRPDAFASRERMRGWLYATKTVFYMNYCCNVFLYSLTGAQFRQQMRAVLFGKSHRSPCDVTLTRFSIRHNSDKRSSVL